MGEKKRISANIRIEIYEKLKECAKEDRRSLSNFVSWILRDWAEHKGTPQRKNNLIGLQVLNAGKEA